jgi:hypothetical protein
VTGDASEEVVMGKKCMTEGRRKILEKAENK